MSGESLTKYNSRLKHWVLQPSPNKKMCSVCFKQDTVSPLWDTVLGSSGHRLIYQAMEKAGSPRTLGRLGVPSVRPSVPHL